jgi:hypothetical protein
MTGQGMAPGRASAPAVGLAGVTVSFRLAERTVFTAVERASLDVATASSSPSSGRPAAASRRCSTSRPA